MLTATQSATRTGSASKTAARTGRTGGCHRQGQPPVPRRRAVDRKTRPLGDLPNASATELRLDGGSTLGAQASGGKLFLHFQDEDLEWLILDSTVIRAHPTLPARKKKRRHGRAGPRQSRGGWGTKIHAAVSGLMTAGDGAHKRRQEADVSHAKALLDACPPGRK